MASGRTASERPFVTASVISNVFNEFRPEIPRNIRGKETRRKKTLGSDVIKANNDKRMEITEKNNDNNNPNDTNLQ